ncbi:MAG: electron transport complex subunit RsxC, partial [Phycisphaerae bacterium]|nr:electron transport complex subunit RsxC [Phycisphaerae bacterium]
MKRLAADAAIEVVPPPAQVAVALLQHTGAPCEPLTKPRQQVALGELIGSSDAFISAPVHATIAGAAQMPSVATLPNGRHVRTIPIKADGEQLSGRELFDDVFGCDSLTSGLDSYAPEQIVEAVRSAGVVGMGGAAFPTHVKLTR